jgi:hypothetical protein
MTYTSSHKNLASLAGYHPPKRNVVNGVGMLGRVFGALFEALHESRRRDTEREIANYVALRGGRITDDLEREITRRLFTSHWSSRG